MSETSQNISLNELTPNETFGEFKNDPRPIDLSDEEIQQYLKASPEERRRIEIGALGYPLTEKTDTTDHA